nr:F-box/LRR-repeat protein 17-like [Ipomoea batatas]
MISALALLPLYNATAHRCHQLPGLCLHPQPVSVAGREPPPSSPVTTVQSPPCLRDELSHFLADRKCLTNLKMKGCSNLGGFILCSSKLSTIWLSDLRCLSKMVFNCPSSKEISLEFSRQDNDNTDIATMVDGFGRSCPRLQNIHIASAQLSHVVVLALAAANLRFECVALVVKFLELQKLLE